MLLEVFNGFPFFNQGIGIFPCSGQPLCLMIFCEVIGDASFLLVCFFGARLNGGKELSWELLFVGHCECEHPINMLLGHFRNIFKK
jgi:hypothetical protein